MTPPDDQLPVVIEPTPVPTPAPADTYIVPALIAELGDQANWRNTYARACSRFFAWCENRGLSLTAIRPFTSRPG